MKCARCGNQSIEMVWVPNFSAQAESKMKGGFFCKACYTESLSVQLGLFQPKEEPKEKDLFGQVLEKIGVKP